ncbi:MAG: MBL fold metallo-hydrolase [Lachnospiraceae bacterium]|nr:MBL fold metallo-hydrolase [Lachnospiraceae bacterium]
MTYLSIDEILPDLYRLRIPLKGNPLKNLNSYVFKESGPDSGKSLVVDTGFRTPDCLAAMEEGLRDIGIDMDRFDILTTHLHSDHTGNVPDMLRPGNHAFMSETDKALFELINGNMEQSGTAVGRARIFRENGIPEDMIQRMTSMSPAIKYAARKTDLRYDGLSDGQEIKAGRYTLKSILVPGHTPGQMCFEVEGTGAMLLGDHVLFDITPNITDWPNVPDSLGDYLDSLEKIDRYEVSIPLPGHREPGDFHQRIAEIKRHHAARLENCHSIIKDLGHACLYDITGRMRWDIRGARNWDEFPDAQRFFALGEALSHIDYLSARGRVIVHVEDGVNWYEAV